MASLTNTALHHGSGGGKQTGASLLDRDPPFFTTDQHHSVFDLGWRRIEEEKRRRRGRFFISCASLPFSSVPYIYDRGPVVDAFLSPFLLLPEKREDRGKRKKGRKERGACFPSRSPPPPPPSSSVLLFPSLDCWFWPCLASRRRTRRKEACHTTTHGVLFWKAEVAAIKNFYQPPLVNTELKNLTKKSMKQKSFNRF